MARYRSLLALSFGLATIASCAFAQTPVCEPDKVAQKYPDYAGKTVKIAVSPTSPPYTYSDPKDQERMTGLEVELIEGVMKCAGLKYEYLKGGWAGLLQSMFTGAADVMPGNVTYRADRAEKVDYVLYIHSGSAVVVYKGNPKGIVDILSMCGTTGSGTTGGASQFFIERQQKACAAAGKPPITFIPAQEADRAYRLVPVQRVDFAIDDVGSAAARVAVEPDMQMGFTATSDLINGFVVPKGNATMLKVVTEGMMVQEKNGQMAAILKKYGLSPELLAPVEARR